MWVVTGAEHDRLSELVNAALRKSKAAEDGNVDGSVLHCSGIYSSKASCPTSCPRNSYPSRRHDSQHQSEGSLPEQVHFVMFDAGPQVPTLVSFLKLIESGGWVSLCID